MTSLARLIHPRILRELCVCFCVILILIQVLWKYIKLLHVLAGDPQRNVMMQRQGPQHNSTAHVFIIFHMLSSTASKVLRDESGGRASLALIAFDQLQRIWKQFERHRLVVQISQRILSCPQVHLQMHILREFHASVLHGIIDVKSSYSVF